ncbi:MAG TPA: DUF998 domain-containing protein [Candidatus Saccharimonadales bacterium]
MKLHVLWGKERRAWAMVTLASLLAVLYCSWPLSYILNPSVGRHDLASELEAPHQPYNWVFIMLDVLSGVGLFALCVMQYRAVERKRRIKWSVISYGIFGLLAAVAAMVPLNCDPTAQQCGALIDDPLILIHGLASILSVVALFVGTVLITGTTYFHESAKKSWKWIAGVVLFCWVAFGAGSLIEMYLNIKSNTLQDFFITVCSLSVIMTVVYVEKLGVTLLEVVEETDAE